MLSLPQQYEWYHRSPNNTCKAYRSMYIGTRIKKMKDDTCNFFFFWQFDLKNIFFKSRLTLVDMMKKQFSLWITYL